MSIGDFAQHGGRFRFFAFTEADPWSWIPVPWITPGTVFYHIGDHRFYELVRQTEKGWYCEEMPASRVGDARHIELVRQARRAYDHCTAALRRLAPKAGTRLEADALLRRREAEREELKEMLIRLCNVKRVKAERAGVELVPLSVLETVAATAALWLLRSMSMFGRIWPRLPRWWSSGWVLPILTAAALGVGIGALYENRLRLPMGRIAGWAGLAALLVIGAMVLHFVLARR